MIDQWVARYQAGDSLKQIAGNTVDPVTVWNHLKKRGLQLRDKIEAQIKAVTKYQRKPFDGSKYDEAYMVGFARGDCQVIRHGRAMRVRTSTTHPAQADLFEELFSPYGHVHRYPARSGLTGFEWHLEVDLDASFSFLEVGPGIAFEKYSQNRLTFFSFLSGFFDAEGSVLFHKKGKWGGFELAITNTNRSLLESLRSALQNNGYNPLVRTLKQKQNRGVGNGGEYIWRLELVRFADVGKLLMEMTLKHQEKKDKATIAALLPLRPTQSALADVKEQWLILRNEIRRERDAFVAEAQSSVISKENNPQKDDYGPGTALMSKQRSE